MGRVSEENAAVKNRFCAQELVTTESPGDIPSLTRELREEGYRVARIDEFRRDPLNVVYLVYLQKPQPLGQGVGAATANAMSQLGMQQQPGIGDWRR